MKENNIPFKREFELTIDEIAENTNTLRIDFFIKYNNKQYFIEYNGEQHYKYIPYFHKGGEIDFMKQQNRDKILEEFCEFYKDKVTLITFNYKQTKQEILNVLKNIFNE